MSSWVKILPPKGESSYWRGFKVLMSLRQEKNVKEIVKGLQSYVTTLTYHQTASFPQVSLPVQIKPLFTVPFERDLKFIGRENILEQVGKRLEVQGRVAFAGIGGVGQVFRRETNIHV
jgi:hypothetical protein